MVKTKVIKGSYSVKDIEKLSSGKVRYDSLTGKSVIDFTISRFGSYMNKILGITMKIISIRYCLKSVFFQN